MSVRHSSRSAGGSCVLESRDMRGIGTDLKITSEACSPMNRGPPLFAAWRSVKPSTQPTLVRTNTRHHVFPYISANSASQDCRFLGKGSGPTNRRLSSVRTSDGEVRRKYTGQTRPKGQIARRLLRCGHRQIGERSGSGGIYAGWILSRHGVIHAPVVDHLSALKGPCYPKSGRSNLYLTGHRQFVRRRPLITQRGGLKYPSATRRSLAAERSEEGSDVFDEKVRLLRGCVMTAAGHDRPSAQIAFPFDESAGQQR